VDIGHYARGDGGDVPIFGMGILSALPRRYLAVNDAILGVNMDIDPMTG